MLIFNSFTLLPALRRAMRSEEVIGRESKGKVSSAFTPTLVRFARILSVAELASMKCLVSKAIPRKSALASIGVNFASASLKRR